jgi:hypothetical protein
MMARRPSWHIVGAVLGASVLGSANAGAQPMTAPQIAPPHAPPTQTTSPAQEQPEPKPNQEKLDVERYELAGFPIVGGNSDIGFQFGGAATWTRFHNDARPYFWNIDLLLSASTKSDASGNLGLIQQSHVLRLDAPDLLNHKLRLDTRGSFQRTINEGYYGIGNAAPAYAVNPSQNNALRLNQYLQEEGRVRVISRIHTGSPLDIAIGANLRAESPSVYAGSKLATDAATRNPDGSAVAVGAQGGGLAGLAGGIMVDTRDSEFITRQGFFYQVGVGATVGSAEGIAYGQASAIAEHFAPLGGPVIFANRLITDFEFGRVPFYDLQQGGVFEPQYLLGSETGIRGVPQGRYAGEIKVVSNTEIRIPLPRFRLFKQRFRFGITTFFDAGRVWAGYSTNAARDGTTLGLKYGVGGGGFLQWGEAAIFRVEAAYSPDAESENPGFPIGIYVSDGLMF